MKCVIEIGTLKRFKEMINTSDWMGATEVNLIESVEDLSAAVAHVRNGLIPVNVKKVSIFNREIFNRSAGDNFFNSEALESASVIQEVPQKASGPAFDYVVSAEVARDSKVIACVFNVTPLPDGTSVKSLVNILISPKLRYEEQSLFLKRLFFRYGAKRLVVNDPSVGLLNCLTKVQVDPAVTAFLPDFKVMNDPKGYSKISGSSICEVGSLYLTKFNLKSNFEAINYVRSQINSGKVKFLVDKNVRRQKLIQTRIGNKMSREEIEKYLEPFNLTSMLKEEMLTLKTVVKAASITVEPLDKNVCAGKFSAFKSGMWWLGQQEFERISADSEKKENNMVEIIGGRATGKTYELMKLAKETNSVFVCYAPWQMEKKALGYGLVGINFISFYEYLKGDLQVGQKVVIDELSHLLRFKGDIQGYSLSVEK